jgi:hypothetical protein
VVVDTLIGTTPVLLSGKFATRPSVDDLNALTRLIDAGQFPVCYTDTFPLADAQRGLEAHRQHETGPRMEALTVLIQRKSHVRVSSRRPPRLRRL